MAPPVHDVDDCQGQHYRLQLNIYKWILEKCYYIQVQQTKVVCAHPHYLPDGFIDEVPDMQATVAKLMQCCRDKKAAVSVQQADGKDEGPGQVPEASDDRVGSEHMPARQDTAKAMSQTQCHFVSCSQGKILKKMIWRLPWKSS